TNTPPPQTRRPPTKKYRPPTRNKEGRDRDHLKTRRFQKPPRPPRPRAQKPPLAKPRAKPGSIRKPASWLFLVSAWCRRERRMKQSSRRARPDKPMPRTRRPTVARRSLPPKNCLAQCRQDSKRLDKQLNLKEPPGEPNLPTHSHSPRPPTKPTICSTSRRKRFAGSRPLPRAPRKQPNPNERLESQRLWTLSLVAANLRTSRPRWKQMRQPVFRQALRESRRDLKQGRRP